MTRKHVRHADKQTALNGLLLRLKPYVTLEDCDLTVDQFRLTVANRITSDYEGRTVPAAQRPWDGEA